MEVKLFGIAKEIVGSATLHINEEVTNVADLKKFLFDSYPDFNSIHSFAVAVERVYADDDKLISSDNEIAIIPPVSGG